MSAAPGAHSPPPGSRAHSPARAAIASARARRLSAAWSFGSSQCSAIRAAGRNCSAALAVLAEVHVCLGEPPAGLDDLTLGVAVFEVGQDRFQDRRGFGGAARAARRAAEQHAGGGARAVGVARLVGPVRGVEGVPAGLVVAVQGGRGLGGDEVGSRAGCRPGTLSGVGRRTHRNGKKVERIT